MVALCSAWLRMFSMDGIISMTRTRRVSCPCVFTSQFRIDCFFNTDCSIWVTAEFVYKHLVPGPGLKFPLLARTKPRTFSTRANSTQLYRRKHMDFSNFNAAEQAYMKRIIDNRQVRTLSHVSSPTYFSNKQMQEFFGMYSRIVQRCFDTCVQDLTRKTLSTKEVLFRLFYCVTMFIFSRPAASRTAQKYS